MCPIERRREAWKRLETDLNRQKLAAMTREIGLSDVLDVAPQILEGKVRGESWSKSRKRVQDLSTKPVHNPLGLKFGPNVL